MARRTLPIGFTKVANRSTRHAIFALQYPRQRRHWGGMLRQYELVERVRAYDPGVDEALLNRAYVFTVQKHGSQKRASGDPYFSHPVEVAGILTDLHLDSETIVTALLHDTLEDTQERKSTRLNSRHYCAYRI